MSLYTIVMLGLGGVGKSSLTIQFISARFYEGYDPTMEDSYRKQVSVDGKDCVLSIFDTAGQEEFSGIRDQYLRTGDGFVLVFSIIELSSFEKIRTLYENILDVKDSEKVPIVLVGNKCDLVDQRKVPKDKGQALAKEISSEYFEASAKNNTNVAETFHQGVREIRKWKLEKRRSRRGSNKKRFKCLLL